MVDTHYIARERENRYGRLRNEMERNGYKRSNSRQGYWRNRAVQLAQRYAKDRHGSRSRSQSGGARVQSGGARVLSQETWFGGSQSKSKDKFKSEKR